MLIAIVLTVVNVESLYAYCHYADCCIFIVVEECRYTKRRYGQGHGAPFYSFFL
jgi:hypothetical protein